VFNRFPCNIYASNTYMPNCSGSTWIVSPGYSWRCSILPYMDQATVYNLIDFSNASATNNCAGPLASTGSTASINTYRAQGTLIPGFVCPSDPTPVANGNNRGTNYASAVRSRGDSGHSATGTFADAGIITRDGCNVASVLDGTSNTIMVGEVYRGRSFFYQGAASCWTFTLASAQAAGRDQTGNRCRDWMATTAYCDCNGAVAVNSGITASGSNPYQYAQLARINDPVNPDCVDWTDNNSGGVTGPRPMSSAHTGGAQSLFGDGSCIFVNENIDGVALAHLFSRAGKETNIPQF
jgi:hypothetical protein